MPKRRHSPFLALPLPPGFSASDSRAERSVVSATFAAAATRVLGRRPRPAHAASGRAQCSVPAGLNAPWRRQHAKHLHDPETFTVRTRLTSASER